MDGERSTMLSEGPIGDREVFLWTNALVHGSDIISWIASELGGSEMVIQKGRKGCSSSKGQRLEIERGAIIALQSIVEVGEILPVLDHV